MDQLSLLDISPQQELTPPPAQKSVAEPEPKPEAETVESSDSFGPGDLVVPKQVGDGPMPAFCDQVCEVARLGFALGFRDEPRVYAFPCKYHGSVPAWPFTEDELLLLCRSADSPPT